MKILLSLLFIFCFSLAIWADIPVYDEEKGKWVSGRLPSPSEQEQQKPEPQGTCMSGVLLSIGIFLLGQRLIKKNELNKVPTNYA